MKLRPSRRPFSHAVAFDSLSRASIVPPSSLRSLNLDPMRLRNGISTLTNNEGSGIFWNVNLVEFDALVNTVSPGDDAKKAPFDGGVIRCFLLTRERRDVIPDEP